MIDLNNIHSTKVYSLIYRNIAALMLLTILLSYSINAYLIAIFLPLPFTLAIISSGILQACRFAVVFMDFVNPEDGQRSKIPALIALGATVTGIIELIFALSTRYKGADFYSMFFFVGTIISFGYLLEVNFMNKGLGVKKVDKNQAIKVIEKREIPSPSSKDSNTNIFDQFKQSEKRY